MKLRKEMIIPSIPFVIVFICFIYSCYTYSTTSYMIDLSRQIGLGLSLISIILYAMDKIKIAVYLLIFGLFIATFWDLIVLLPEHRTIWLKLGFIELLIPTFECFLLITVVICCKDYHLSERQRWLAYWDSLPK